MIVLNAVYTKPEDEIEFKDHYHNVHMPLVAKTPGLLKTDIEYVSSVYIGNKDDYFMIARMYFENKDTFAKAMKSDENQAAGKDLMRFAKGRVSLYVTEHIDS